MIDIFGKKEKALKKRIAHMESQVQGAFQKVRKDMIDINAWLQYYHDKSKHLEDQLTQVYTTTSQNTASEEHNSQFLVSQSEQVNRLADNMNQVLTEVSRVGKQSSENRVYLQTHSTEHAPRNELNFHIENISTELKRVDSKVEQLSFLPGKVDALKNEVTEHLNSPHGSTEVESKINALQEKLNSIIVKKTPKEKLVQKVTKNSHDYIKAMVLSYIGKYQKISGYQLREMIVEEQNITSKSTLYRILDEIEKLDEISTIRQGKEKIFLRKIIKPA